jgi:Protein of unknown function (DUF1573)
MKNWIVLAALLIGCSVAGTLAVQFWPTNGAGTADLPIFSGKSNKPKGDQPKAVVDMPYDYNFGTLPQRTTGKHEWNVKNTGKADLEVWMISSTCSCTLAKFKDGKKAVVKPGETTQIMLEYETRENNGEYAKGAEIGTNDPDLQSFSLMAKGKVFPAVMTLPAEPVVNFGTISNENEDNATALIVYSYDRPETKVVKVTCVNPNVVGEASAPSADEVKRLEGGGVKKGTKVTIHVKSGMPLGTFRDEILIQTDHPKQPELRLMLAGKMNGPINLMPAGLPMHDVYSKAGATGELNVIVASQRPTKFEVVKKPEQLKVEVVPSDTDKKPGRYRLVVTVPPGTPPVRIEDEIVLKTDHPKAGTVIVPVSIWVLNAD